ncbi:YidH family protein [Actinocorallia populi]|uniref:YidH family protein n=1 Tax=Actinocorallia populi TaxID=2079200 RepID=UPI000D096F8E|nr:DUF202 domain-containing protein [Actinocorallia populi]
MNHRFPRWVYAEGTEPDPRFTLANERTFLAWVRTSLALIGGGIALEALPLPLQPAFRAAAALLLLLLGLLVPVLAWLSWAVAERRMRRREPLPSSWVTAPLAIGVSAVAALTVLGALTR